MRSFRKPLFDKTLGPTGKSLPIYGNCVKPQNEKYFAFPEGQIRTISPPSRPAQRASAVVTTRDGDAVDAKAAIDETRPTRTAKACGPDVAVLASMHPEAIASGALRRQKSRSSGRARYKP